MNIGSHSFNIEELPTSLKQPLLSSVTKPYAAPYDLAQCLYQHLPIAVFVKAGRNGAITFWNKQAELLFGVAAEQVIGKTLHDFLPLILADRMEECDRVVLQTGVQTTVEETIEHPVENHKILQIVRVPLAEENQSPCVLCVINDITDQKRAEAIRQQQAEQT
ncbi:MAG: PAS domain-containing protein, partial [Leptolyngbyaceae cyanobacterium CAN_BIN12]|nr:PAS domain-containing protein [Leptolyngbyaceae cyanobacterium CAN_BIN12]